jgi:hypothetical protein
MPNSCEVYYRQLHISCGVVLSETFAADETGQQATAHHFIDDLQQWYAILEVRPESPLFLAAQSEYQFALLAVALGQYRQAFMSLRLSFELTLGAVYYSANELKLRQWMKGTQDLNWSALVDRETGVFSKTFVGAFYEDLAEFAREYGAIAERLYREISEYVHGNANTHSTESGKVIFQKQAFDSWHQKSKSVRLATSFALCARYVRLMTDPQRTQLESVLLDNLGHISSVRAILGGPVEEIND